MKNQKSDFQESSEDYSVEEFATKNRLSVASLRAEDGIIILPNNLVLADVSEHQLFSPFSKEILVTLQEAGLQARLYADDRKRRELVLKSATIVLPVLYFLGPMVSGVALGVISNWIYDKLKKYSKNDGAPTIKYADAVVKSDGTIRYREIEGPADKVSKILLSESKLGSTVAKSRHSLTHNPAPQPICDTVRRATPKKTSRKRSS